MSSPEGNHSLPPPLRPTYFLVDLDLLAHNVRELRRITAPGTQLMTVIKADGYGHGLLEAAPVCLANGAGWLGVATVDEALALRCAGFTAPVLVLGYSAPWQATALARADIAVTVMTAETAVALSDAAAQGRRRARVHIKVDSGMSRLGIWPDDAGLELVERIARLPGLELEGIFTHFASADEADKAFTHQQFARYLEFVGQLAGRGIEFALRHVANSAALLDLPETHLDLVRPGVMIAGVWPSADVQRRIDLRPSQTLVTQIAYLKELAAGRKISYGGTYETTRPTVLATLPLGYHDGYKRGLSNKAEMLVRGVRAPVRGRVCMDQSMIDVSGIPGVAAGDSVVALGCWGAEAVTADELGVRLGSIGYEIVTTVGARVPRLYVQDGRPVKVRCPLGSWAVDSWQDLPWPGVEATYLATRPTTEG